jgi:DNA-directed RNA polymerase III subunit RPC3
VLVQENLVYHHFDEDTNATHYEAHPEAAYMLVRSGKIVEIARSRYGDLAAEIVGNLFLSGHSTVKELVSWYQAKSAEVEAKRKREERLQNGHNGQGKASAPVQTPAPAFSTGQIHGMLTELLESGLIQPLSGDMFLSPTDTYDNIAKETLKEEYGGNIKGTKQKEELKEKIRERLYALRSEREWKPKGKKRSLNGNHANGVNGASKRRRLSNGAVNGDYYIEDDGTRLDVGFPRASEQDTIAC